MPIGEEDFSKKYSLDYNKPLATGLSLSRDFESNRKLEENGFKSSEFDYKKGYQFQYYEEKPKY